MRKGEEGEISDEAILSDLLSAGYVEELEHIITSKETVPKKKTGKKKATK